MENQEIDRLAKIIWDYHKLGHKLKKVDCIFVLGSHDIRVAEYAADLFLEGFAPHIIFSGGLGNLTRDIFEKPEAELFAEAAISRGVPEEKILIENQSTNTGENVRFTRNLLEKRGLDFKAFILVQKPYMERRTYATFKKVWPEPDIIVTSPQLAFSEYFGEYYTRDYVINVMVGDLQRLRVYPDLGYQIPQAIPAEVWAAYKALVAAGYTKHLLAENRS
jgi:uncharacterized SAM-binding protein YcdF (DUF218 family)